MKLKSARAIARMRDAGRLVAESFALLQENIKPGVSLRVLDQLVESYIHKQGAQPLYKGYQGSSADHPPFPGVICASVNHEICHGLPDDRILKEGDSIGIDIGLKYKGYCGDACVTFPVGKVSPATERMLEIGKEALNNIRRPGPEGMAAPGLESLNQIHQDAPWVETTARTVIPGPRFTLDPSGPHFWCQGGAVPRGLLISFYPTPAHTFRGKALVSPRGVCYKTFAHPDTWAIVYLHIPACFNPNRAAGKTTLPAGGEAPDTTLNMVAVAQLVRALGCGPRGRGFNSPQPPHFISY